MLDPKQDKWPNAGLGDRLAAEPYRNQAAFLATGLAVWPATGLTRCPLCWFHSDRLAA